MAISRRALLGASVATAAGMAVSATPAASQGKAGRSRKKGEAAYSRNRPNLLVIVLDDVGFAELGCYGSEIPTPAIDSVARRGVVFNNFHSSPMCSPTRAALLTGRNPHSIGVGTIADWSDGRPGYRGTVDPDIEMLPALLSKQGFGCYGSGKWHLTRLRDEGPSGPYDDWPTRRGFDRWFGFQGATADQWYPELFEGTSVVSDTRNPGDHLSENLVDKMIGYLSDHMTGAPDRPFFGYLAFGACHWPLQVPAQFVERSKGRYDEGWHKLRERRFQNQKALGLIPEATVLPPENPDVPDWNNLAAPERQFAARLMEVYAGFLEHTDAQIGRLLTFLTESNVLDDTMVVILSDNGATAEGASGAADFRQQMYMGGETAEERADALEILGGDTSFPVYSQGWAAAGNSPMRWYKSTAHEGGIRTPLIVSLPGGGFNTGGIRNQFHHVSDVAPTFFEIAKLDHEGFEGTSFAYLFSDPVARSRKPHQIFESTGSRAVWKDGWKAVTRHEAGTDFSQDRWELFHSDADFSEARDLALTEGDRLAALKGTWEILAREGNVLPLSDKRSNAPNLPERRDTYILYPTTSRLDRLSIPDFRQAHRITAQIDINPLAQGVILAVGNAMRGFECYLSDGELHYVFVLSRRQNFHLRSGKLPSGACNLAVELGDGAGPREARMIVNEEVVGRMKIKRSWPSRSLGAGLRVAENRGAPISRNYDGSFPIRGGSLRRVIIDMG